MAKSRKTTLDERIDIVGYCIANNKDYGKAIEQYGVSYQQIYEWVRKHEKSSPDGLSDHRGKCKKLIWQSCTVWKPCPADTDSFLYQFALGK